jgi:16S rRNA (adenine1518-N6/adenine1519-N6)-dimethyltransferase
MMQREVAERLVAQPPAMTVLTVATQILATAEIAFLLPAESFVPAPKVESAVVTLTPLGEERLAAGRRALFFQLVNAGFRHKRKQILNSLAFEIDLPKEELSKRLNDAGIDPLRRAQTLAVDEWLTLLETWERAEQGA